MEIPLYSVDLIKSLRKLYPKRTPQPTDSMSLVMYRAGQCSVIDGLEASLNIQDENILEIKAKE